MSTFKYEMGSVATDKITKCKGVIVSRHEYITGCNQYGIQPKGKGTDRPDTQWFDEQRLVIQKTGRVYLQNKKPGGPQAHPSK